MAELSEAEHRAGLATEVGADAVRWDGETLAAHRRDTWCLSVLRGMRGELDNTPLCVVSPTSTEAVARALRYCRKHQLAVVPFGGGSGVCGAVLPGDGTVVIDLRRMNRILELNETSLYVRVEAGMMGGEFEAALNRSGYSARNFPQSIDLSTVGGWVATRAAGQYSSRYGNTEDLLLALEAVLPDGHVIRTKVGPRAATGPDLRHVFLGSEGTLGIVTEVTYAIVPLPESTVGHAFSFPSMSAGLDAIRRLVREGWRPPVIRLYDNPEVARLFPDNHSGDNALLLMLSEGAPSLVAAEVAGCRVHCEAVGGSFVGDGPVERWRHHRNQVPTFESLLEKGLVVDTIEVAATWDRIEALYDNVIAALKTVPGIIVASGHSSHSYPQGTNIYFTFAAFPEDPAKAEWTYLECWAQTMEATLASGGTIAHHHGIGRVRKAWMEREHGAGLDLLRRIKHTLDPHDLMNPGALFPPA